MLLLFVLFLFLSDAASHDSTVHPLEHLTNICQGGSMATFVRGWGQTVHPH